MADPAPDPAPDPAAFTRFEEQGWDRIPGGYDRLLGPVTAQAAGALLDAAGAGAASTVLDVATGPGYIAGRALARGATVIAVDLSEAMVAYARQAHPGLDVRRADAHELPFADGSFTAAVAGFLLPHVADPARMVAEVARVVAPGGRLALSMWDQPERSPFLGAIVSAVAEVGAEPTGLPEGPPFFAYADPERLRGLLAGAGLQAVEVTPLAFRHRVGTAAELWDAVVGGTVRTSALVTSQAPERQRAIRAAFERIVAAYGEPLDLGVSVLIASGTKVFAPR